MQRLLLFLIFSTCSYSLFAQENTDRRNPEAKRAELTEPGYFLVSGEIPPRSRVIQLLSGNRAVIYLKSPPDTTLFNLHSINNSWKMAPGLPAHPPYLVTLRSGGEADKFLQAFPSAVFLQNNYYRLDSGIPEEIAALPGVVYISPLRVPRSESLVPFNNHGINRIDAFQQLYSNFQGEGETISIKELAYDPEDPDLRGRSLEEIPGLPVSIHATEMATLAAGSGLLDQTTEGVSPGAALKQASYNSLFAESDTYYGNVTVQNHSYGTQPEPFYGPEAASYDQSVQQIPWLVHVFSIGNAGNQSPENGPYQGITGFNTLTGNFKNAKNILTISSTNSSGTVIPLNSSGPTFDGRIRPELTAFGEGGTSDAAAMVSGAAAALSGIYTTTTGKRPDFHMMKAILLASADDTGSEGPDYHTGYGQLNMVHAAEIITRENFIEFSGELDHTIAVPEGAGIFRVLLSWTDPPASPGDEILLRNDLDLTVTNPSGQVFEPWILSRYPHPDSLNLPAKRGKDHWNTQEIVSILNPEAGIYTIHVAATSGQAASLAWHTEDADFFTWRYPLENSALEAGTQADLYWDTGLQGEIVLSWGTGNGEWFDLGTAELSAEHFTFTVPDTTAALIIRAVHGASTFTTSLFAVSPKPHPGVDYLCDDEWKISWEALPGATSYTLLGRQNNKLVTLASVESTQARSGTFPYSDSLIAVQANAGDTPAMRSTTFHLGRQGTGCYFSGFTGGRENDAVRLTMQLGTTDGVESIEIRRLNDNMLVWQSSVPGTEEIVFDNQPLTGPNRYEAVIYLEDGRQITSEIITVLFVPAGEVLLYPNPVQSGQVLNVISTDPEIIFQLISLQGQTIVEIPLETFREEIPMTIAPGIYLYRINSPGGSLGTGRIAVY